MSTTTINPPPRTSDERPGASPSYGPWWGVGVALAVYLALAFIANAHVWADGFAHTLQRSGGQDTSEEVWFLAQTPWALVHGVNPFFTTWLNAPVGINLMDNTTMALLGLLGTPITLVFGPIATYNVMIVLGFAGSAMAFYLMARRLVHWWPAAFVGGLLYGFSPFAVAVGSGHLFLLFQVFPPLIALVVIHFVQADCRSPWTHGAALGACLAGQFFVSTEMFASLCVMMVLACVVAVPLWRGSKLTVDHRAVGKAVSMAIIVTILVLGYGAWMAFRGPQHITGPAQSASALVGLSNDPLGVVAPTANQHFTFGHQSVADKLVAVRAPDWYTIRASALAENGDYVGIPLVIVLAVGLILLRRRRLLVFFGILAAGALVLSMGPYLHLDGHRTGIPLPFDALAHLPLLDSAVSARYASYFWLFAALVLAGIVDSLYRVTEATGRRRGAVLCAALCVGALLPLVPAWPYRAASAAVPSWFTAQGRSLPTGSTVLVYPGANAVHAEAMLWQAMADENFRMPGGYAVFATPGGAASFAPASSLLGTELNFCDAGYVPQITDRAVREGIRRVGATTVVVVPGYKGSPCATRLFDDALGPHLSVGGVEVWRP